MTSSEGRWTMKDKESSVKQFVMLAQQESFVAIPFTRERASYPAAEALRLAIQMTGFM